MDVVVTATGTEGVATAAIGVRALIGAATAGVVGVLGAGWGAEELAAGDSDALPWSGRPIKATIMATASTASITAQVEARRSNGGRSVPA